MGGNPRAGRPHVVRPSPLQQVSHTRPLSSAPPTSGLVRDPLFWKRFSVAVHAAEVCDEESGKGSVKSGNTVEIKAAGYVLLFLGDIEQKTDRR
ncbi:uncharacterized protein LY89DRAFT_680867 [Mollisia scopiformis]|uniref:Uncharacterized protein n=1 Tax=Mollisia scopiformis TaxID=149040 RepID=A0A194XR40_MOLSC|nr:uncharacterized protein LY89DRAFT_680867 [Mollisia scopiformis]KUJ22755.1 hypothetical protein LY89DRAFT_680867 [Mollisia scopiformis]